jgi:NAD(P)-dependent dehydrogenase (short-subunit alcohol dehydrogenase family)
MERFTEKRVFITGAASGLGRAFALRFAEMGWKVAIVDIHIERLSETKSAVEAFGVSCLDMECDVTSFDALSKCAERIEEEWGGVDIVLNNAGIAGVGQFEDITHEEWERVINVDLWSVIHGCRVFVPMLKRQGGGHIVNTASSAGIVSLPQMANYNVAKAGVISLSESLRAELAEDNIGVTVIAPTVFKANLVEDPNLEKHQMGRSFRKEIEKTKVTAEQIADITIAAIKKNKLYVVPQADAKRAWFFKRFFPELYFKTIIMLYRKRLWLFAGID